jgi:hypothetical protein
MNHINLIEGLNIDQNCTVTRQETRASLGEIRFYQDYDYIYGEWRGVGLTNSQYFDSSGQKVEFQ